jgi:hypothetical protein
VEVKTLRLFPGYEVEALEAPSTRPFLLARLLEDGDGADLRQLFQAVPEREAVAWLASHGRRQLSVRSRAFWAVVLGSPAGPAIPDVSVLWPL